MDANDSSIVSMTSCSCHEPLPLFSVIDLDTFQHEPQVEEYIKNFSDSPSLPELAEAKISWSSLSDGSVPDVCKLMPARIPDLIDVVPEVKLLPTPPSIVQALHQFKADITAMMIAAMDYYECLQVSIVDMSPSMPPRDHIYSGALASTTKCKQCLWAYNECDDEENSKTTRFKVADDMIHVPTAIGFSRFNLKVSWSTGV